MLSVAYFDLWDHAHASHAFEDNTNSSDVIFYIILFYYLLFILLFWGSSVKVSLVESGPEMYLH